MYTVYIIKSEKTTPYYIGVTSDINQRLRHHNSGANRWTKNKSPWKIIYQEHFDGKKKLGKEKNKLKVIKEERLKN